MQEFEEKEEKSKKIIDIKGTLESFIEEEKPELSQEEEIKAYKEGDIIKYPKNKKGAQDEEDENEDDEHLKRIKKALLESLKRVDTMEKKIFEEKGKENIKNIKVKSKSQKTKEKEIEKEKVIEQMRQKMKEEEEKGRSREEWI